MIGPRTNISEKPHRVTLQNPGPVIPNDDGGYSQTWFDLNPPAMSAAIAPASAQELERVVSSTVIAQATHIVKMAFHPQVTTKTRLVFNGRSFSVTGIANPDERSTELVLVCVEVVK